VTPRARSVLACDITEPFPGAPRISILAAPTVAGDPASIPA
jgi:hypothetical protein